MQPSCYSSLIHNSPPFKFSCLYVCVVHLAFLLQKYDKDGNIPELEITEVRSIEYAAIIWKIDVVEVALLFTA